MKRIATILMLAPLAFARVRFPATGGGYCQQGGKTTVTSGMSSSTVNQGSFPRATVTVTITGGALGYVNTSGTSVTWVSGAVFNANSQWNSLTITINSVTYTISSCSTPLQCTLTSSAGTQSSVTYSVANAPAALFSDNNGTILANPFTCDSTGYYFFYADNGSYDVRFSGTGISTPFTNAGMWGFDPIASAPNWIVYSPISGTAAAQCSAAQAAHTTLIVTQVMPSLPSQTMACSIVFLGGGMVQPASGQTVTITGPILAPFGLQIFDQSLGGTVMITTSVNDPVQSAFWYGSPGPISVLQDIQAISSNILWQEAVDASTYFKLSGTPTGHRTITPYDASFSFGPLFVGSATAVTAATIHTDITGFTLSGGTATVTLDVAFTSTSTFACSTTGSTAFASATPASASTVTVTGTGTDTGKLICVGS